MSTTEIANDVFDNKISNKTIARRLKKYGIQARDSKYENNYFWNGGIKIDKSGYRLIKCNNHPHADSTGYIREHRLIMEEHVGRYLTPEELVHHINANKQDNRIENLELMESNSAHAILESQFRQRDEIGRYT